MKRNGRSRAHTDRIDIPPENPEKLRRDTVVAGLRQAIIDGRLLPSERIRQEQVARDYQTSRIPVREALQQLQAEGFVTLEPNIGARVATLDFKDLDEIYRIRECIEPLAMLQSVPALTSDDLTQLEAKQHKMNRMAEQGDPSSWIQQDREFHLLAMSRSPFARLKIMIDGLWNISAQYRRLYALTSDRLAVAHSEHELLIEAMNRRDALAASELCRLHIRRTRLSVMADVQIFGLLGGKPSRR